MAALLLGVSFEQRLIRELHPLHQQQPTANRNVSPIPTLRTAAENRPTAERRTLRPVYGHSLVRGGVRSVAELMALIQADPQLAQHYQGFDLSKAHIITLDHNVVAYVSYRLEDGIYWTTHPILIPKGNEVITDGVNFIREACGNRIAYAPGTPVRPGEPQDMEVIVAFTLPPATPPSEPTTAPEPSGGLTRLSHEAPPSVSGYGWIPSAGSGGNGPPPQFSADEFPPISIVLFAHAVKVPTMLTTFLAGILLMLMLLIALRRVN
jgi:hypothetical protein